MFVCTIYKYVIDSVGAQQQQTRYPSMTTEQTKSAEITALHLCR